MGGTARVQANSSKTASSATRATPAHRGWDARPAPACTPGPHLSQCMVCFAFWNISCRLSRVTCWGREGEGRRGGASMRGAASGHSGEPNSCCCAAGGRHHRGRLAALPPHLGDVAGHLIQHLVVLEAALFEPVAHLLLGRGGRGGGVGQLSYQALRSKASCKGMHKARKRPLQSLDKAKNRFQLALLEPQQRRDDRSREMPASAPAREHPQRSRHTHSSSPSASPACGPLQGGQR